jgi:hypothetical protein
MTVCVAAIAEKSIIIGVSDRMLTAGEIEFEPEQSKIWFFSSAIIALFSGDAAIQGQLLKQTYDEVKVKIDADPTNWMSVKDIATLYCQEYRELRKSHAETEILSPLVLTIQSYLEKQATLNGRFGFSNRRPISFV